MDGEAGERGAVTEDRTVEDLFRNYAGGFDDFDAEAIAACFAYPATLWQDGRGNVFDDEDDLIENIEALLTVFEQEEVVHSSFEILEMSSNEASGSAHLRWQQQREDGETALEFSCRYLLVRDADGWLIAATVTD